MLINRMFRNATATEGPQTGDNSLNLNKVPSATPVNVNLSPDESFNSINQKLLINQLINKLPEEVFPKNIYQIKCQITQLQLRSTLGPNTIHLPEFGYS